MSSENRIGVIGIFLDDPVATAVSVNGILSQYAHIIVGRMGLPYREKSISIISLIVDGSTDEIGALSGKLGAIAGVRAKSMLSPAKSSCQAD